MAPPSRKRIVDVVLPEDAIMTEEFTFQSIHNIFVNKEEGLKFMAKYKLIANEVGSCPAGCADTDASLISLPDTTDGYIVSITTDYYNTLIHVVHCSGGVLNVIKKCQSGMVHSFPKLSSVLNKYFHLANGGLTSRLKLCDKLRKHAGSLSCGQLWIITTFSEMLRRAGKIVLVFQLKNI